MPTKSELARQEVYGMIRARNPVIWVVTREEARVEGYIAEAALTAEYEACTWDVAAGFATITGETINKDIVDPDEALKYIEAESKKKGARKAWIMRDMGPWLVPPIGLTPQRRLRNLARALPEVDLKEGSPQVIIVFSTSPNVPEELLNDVSVINWPLPDREEVAELLDDAISRLDEKWQAKALVGRGAKDAAIDAAVGLTGAEAEACFARSLVQTRKIDPKTVAGAKKEIVSRDGLVQWYDPLPGGLAAVGGLGNLKRWLDRRKLAYSAKARAYGLPPPKGALLAGVPGCGKSMTAKATSAAWGVPLLKLDLGALKSKFVGDSEARIRRALQVIESIGRCVVWIDELEKALAGATQGAADGGVSSDSLGVLLNWMQERKGEAFVLATANDAEKLPPELMRKGRFDCVFFVDLPNFEEKVEVLKAALAAHGRGDLDVSLGRVAEACTDFTSSEIAALVPEAMFKAFAEDRELTTEDLLFEAEGTVPLAKTAEGRIADLRRWGAANAVPASDTPAARMAVPTRRGRRLEMGTV